MVSGQYFPVHTPVRRLYQEKQYHLQYQIIHPFRKMSGQYRQVPDFQFWRFLLHDSSPKGLLSFQAQYRFRSLQSQWFSYSQILRFKISIYKFSKLIYFIFKQSINLYKNVQVLFNYMTQKI
ncbi:hypothetical protein FGO68_gene8124 [Halteria grandinella]|uniref:Uncharacterized protein n=1 Tax=Halteria grandinella TaxID=5974 RepID=A0A8J8SV46_HALGN|nr:hypothetical protein FGO68_gene8124 [Halteria grandinella]